MKTLPLIGGLAALMLSACTSMEVAAPDPETGRLEASHEAVVVSQKAVPLDEKKDLILVTANDFFVKQTAALGYFGEVIDREELEAIVIRENLIEQVPGVQDKIGIARAARAYEPFLWLEVDVREDDASNKLYLQLILQEAATMEELWRAERYIDTVWAGMNDQNTFYPLFNALLDYIEENSEER